MAFYNGSGNVYRNNTVAFVPHSGILGRGVNMSFIGNTLDTNCFETTDVGAFYTDGEGFAPLSSNENDDYQDRLRTNQHQGKGNNCWYAQVRLVIVATRATISG